MWKTVATIGTIVTAAYHTTFGYFISKNRDVIVDSAKHGQQSQSPLPSELPINDEMRVSNDDEGKDLDLRYLDRLTDHVHFHRLAGPLNKDHRDGSH